MMSYVDLCIEVERVLKDYGTFAARRPLLYRTLDKRAYRLRSDGTYELVFPRPHPDSQYPMVRPGERYLFFLSRDPNGSTYGVGSSMYGRLVIDGVVVRASDGARTPLNLGQGPINSTEFVRQVEEAVAAGEAR